MKNCTSQEARWALRRFTVCVCASVLSVCEDMATRTKVMQARASDHIYGMHVPLDLVDCFCSGFFPRVVPCVW
jgi:hypothetical protein